jgi:E3 ubiquitin-protein ligase RNF13
VSGSAEGIDIYAVFVSWITGQALLGAVGERNATCTLQPAVQDTAWSIMAVSSISLLAISAVLSTFFFVRRHRLRHLGSRLPTFVFKGADGEEAGGGETCAICLEDYESGEKLRLLPCHHGICFNELSFYCL